MPLLIELGYGEHTVNRIKEQASYALRDPRVKRGSRRTVILDYQPTVCEHRLWLIEAKGANRPVSLDTLRQARDYAQHPEVRAALAVVIDADGLAVYDPQSGRISYPPILPAP